MHEEKTPHSKCKQIPYHRISMVYMLDVSKAMNISMVDPETVCQILYTKLMS